MTDQELELRLKNAVEACTPDVLDKIMEGCKDCDKGEILDTTGKSRDRHRQTQKGRRAISKIGTMAAMLVFILGMGVFGSVQYGKNRIVSVVQLDVNPSVELRINKKEEVVKAEGINPDGKQILEGMKLEGLDIYTATNAIVGSMLKNGYIDELANSILLSVEDEDSIRGDKLKYNLSGEINAILEGASVHASILSQYVDGKSVDSISKEYGISHGKAALIEHILASNDKYTFEELSKLSVNELNLIISNPKNQIQDVESSGEAAKDAYIGETEANRVAFAHAGVAESSVYELEVEIDYEFGTMVYDVEFESDGKEYEYFIDAVSGTLLEADVEHTD